MELKNLKNQRRTQKVTNQQVLDIRTAYDDGMRGKSRADKFRFISAAQFDKIGRRVAHRSIPDTEKLKGRQLFVVSGAWPWPRKKINHD